MEPLPRARFWRTLAPFLATVVLFHVLVIVTYPMFSSGDGLWYLKLLEERRSSLVHAGGYSFFLSLLGWPGMALGLEPIVLLPYLQHGLAVGALVVFYAGLVRFVQPLLAAIAVGLLGLDPLFVGSAHTTEPEWLQSCFLMALAACVCGAATSDRPVRALSLSFWAGVSLSAAYVTKYNSLAAVFLLALIPWQSPLSWRRRVQALMAAAIGGALLLGIFVFGFHRPTTGTTTLNLEHGYIYLSKLGYAGVRLEPEYGIATQKYLILTHLLPAEPSHAHTWDSLDAIPDTVRAPYRERFGPLLATEDAQLVRRIYDEAVGGSLAPEGGSALPDDFANLYVYLGLFEAESLLKAVAREAFVAEPRPYLTDVRITLVESLYVPVAYHPSLPTPFEHWPLRVFLVDREPNIPRARLVQRFVWWGTDEDPELVLRDVWPPGALVYGSVFWAMRILWQVGLWAALIALPCMAYARFRRDLPPTAVDRLFAVTSVSLWGFVLASCLLFLFRNKELLVCMPLIASALACAVQVLCFDRGLGRGARAGVRR